MCAREPTSSDGGNTSLSWKLETRNSLELISITTGDRDVSTSGVHSWKVSPDSLVDLEELEYLKIETRLIDEMFASVMGECVI